MISRRLEPRMSISFSRSHYLVNYLMYMSVILC